MCWFEFQDEEQVLIEANSHRKVLERGGSLLEKKQRCSSLEYDFSDGVDFYRLKQV